jgi:hypothetical protein
MNSPRHSRFTRIHSTILCFLAGCASALAVTPDVTFARASLCQALADADDGSKTLVTVSGIFVAGGERQILYDPDQRICPVDVQEITAIQFERYASLDPRFRRIVDRDGRAFVTFEGVSFGPAPAAPDILALPPMAAFANRVAGRRYGHLSAFRTQLLVKRVVDFRPVPATVPDYGDSAPPPPVASAPVIRFAETPHYPEFARRAGISGIVRLQVTVKGGKVDSTVIAGDRLLAEDSRKNVATWRIDGERDWSFETTFTYVLEKRATGANPNVTIELRLPESVKVVAPVLGW